MSDLTKGWRTNDEQITVDRLNAEILRLKNERMDLEKQHADLIERVCMVYIPTITELADWADENIPPELLQRAREAVK